MTMRVTIIKSPVYSPYGIAYPLNSVQTVEDGAGLALISQGKATDTDGVIAAGSNDVFLQGHLFNKQPTALNPYKAAQAQGVTDTLQTVAATKSLGRASVLENRCLIGHRGAGGIAGGTSAAPSANPNNSIGTLPENLLSSIRKAYAMGVRVFELDSWGVNGYMMHDQNPARVCTPVAWVTGTVYQTGTYVTSDAAKIYLATLGGTAGVTAPTGTAITPISDGGCQWVYKYAAASFPTDITALTLAEFRDLRVTPSIWLGAGYENEAPPTIRDVVQEFGGRAYLILESKDANGGQAIANALAEFNVPIDMAACGSFTPGWTSPVTALGYPAIQYSGTPTNVVNGGGTLATCIAACKSYGAIALGTTSTWTADQVAAYNAAGILAFSAVSQQRRSEMEAQFAVGVNGIFVDDINMMFPPTPMESSFSGSRRPPGMVPWTYDVTHGGRGIMRASTGTVQGGGADADSFSYDVQGNGQNYSTTWLTIPAGTFKFTIWISIESVSAANQGPYIGLYPSDAAVRFVSGTAGVGLTALFRQSGVQDIYETNGTIPGSPSATASGTALTISAAPTTTRGVRYQVSIERTATQLIVINITNSSVTTTYTPTITPFGQTTIFLGHTQSRCSFDTPQRVY